MEPQRHRSSTLPSSRTQALGHTDEHSARSSGSSTLPVSIGSPLEKPLSQEEFVIRIKDHALEKPKHALYPGENFQKLAKYLSRFPSREPEAPETAIPALFATLYLLQDPGDKDFPSEDLQTVEDLQRVDSRFRDIAKARNPNHAVNEILFLRGFPSASWLRTVGSYFRVDPEFYRRHLDFSLLPHQNWFSTPSLPSTSDNILRIRITSLARRKPEVPDIEMARTLASEAMTPYIGRLLDFDANIGDSIVRKFSLHNEKYFSLEQDISICCCKQERGWTVIAWLDSGKDLVKGRPGPWMTTDSPTEDSGSSSEKVDFEFEMISVIRNEPRTAIHSSQSTQKSRQLRERAAMFHQNRALLNLDYGGHFEDLKVYEDPFYSIIPMFKHKALAETQFLNLVESVLVKDLESTRLAKPMGAGYNRDDLYLRGLRTSHANFVYHRELLESHSRCLRENLWSIKSRGGPDWPRSNDKKVVKTVNMLRKDYEWLKERVKELSALCDRGMKDIHDKATLTESVRSNDVAEEVRKLTNLATLLTVIYVPLSFTTGLFGMNFSVFGQGHVKVWWWFVVALPILAISFTVIYSHKIGKGIRGFLKKSRRQKHKKGKSDPWA